jgi:hypothetical protein
MSKTKLHQARQELLAKLDAENDAAYKHPARGMLKEVDPDVMVDGKEEEAEKVRWRDLLHGRKAYVRERWASIAATLKEGKELDVFDSEYLKAVAASFLEGDAPRKVLQLLRQKGERDPHPKASEIRAFMSKHLPEIGTTQAMRRASQKFNLAYGTIKDIYYQK